jgi:hypothetical protein
METVILVPAPAGSKIEGFELVTIEKIQDHFLIYTRGLSSHLEYDLYVDGASEKALPVIRYILGNAGRVHLTKAQKFIPGLTFSITQGDSVLWSKLSMNAIAGFDSRAPAARYLQVSPSTPNG